MKAKPGDYVEMRYFNASTNIKISVQGVFIRYQYHDEAVILTATGLGTFLLDIWGQPNVIFRSR